MPHLNRKSSAAGRVRLFVAHRFDGLSDEAIGEAAESYRRLFETKSVEVVSMAHLLKEERAQGLAQSNPRLVVERDLEELRSADIFLCDLSEPNWHYVGCLCEMVYAKQWDKYVIVYAGQAPLAQRLWIRYHADVIALTPPEAKAAVERYLAARMET